MAHAFLVMRLLSIHKVTLCEIVTGHFFIMPSRNLVNVKVLEMKLSMHFHRF
jgi:hypothetical protein